MRNMKYCFKKVSVFHLSLKSVCQVVEEEIVGLISLEPGSSRALLSSLSYTLGIPLLLLDSSARPPPASALSSIINLSPASEMVGKALTDVIKAKSGMNSVMVYKTDNEFLWNALWNSLNINGNKCHKACWKNMIGILGSIC